MAQKRNLRDEIRKQASTPQRHHVGLMVTEEELARMDRYCEEIGISRKKLAHVAMMRLLADLDRDGTRGLI